MISRVLRALVWEPGEMVVAMGWRYRQAREHRRWSDGFRAGIELGRQIERKYGRPAGELGQGDSPDPGLDRGATNHQ